MLAVTEAKQLLDSLSLSEVNGIYAFSVPAEYVNDKDKTQIRIADTNTIPEEYGNDVFHALNREVQVQIFYRQDINFNEVDRLETRILKAFNRKNWLIEDISEHLQDPDTGQLSCSFYFEQIKQT